MSANGTRPVALQIQTWTDPATGHAIAHIERADRERWYGRRDDRPAGITPSSERRLRRTLRDAGWAIRERTQETGWWAVPRRHTGRAICQCDRCCAAWDAAKEE
ncbi:MAG: hypothetical protein M5U01_10010 [Ardenticatenaceae bacterium]|nr:hypothetical protein [Ardenticatenaceae bacterium]